MGAGTVAKNWDQRDRGPGGCIRFSCLRKRDRRKTAFGVTNLAALERVAGIEPASSAWKAAALPLCYTRDLCRVLSLVSPFSLGPTPSFQPARGGGSRTRTCEGDASGFTVRPLCHSGHSPSRATDQKTLVLIYELARKPETSDLEQKATATCPDQC